jgi:hypothetical protein
MNPEQRDPSLAAAMAVARRLLVRAIDVRFDLDEAFETANGSHRLSLPDRQRLRADAAALHKEIDRLTLALSLFDDPDPGEVLDEESDEAMV